MANTSKGYLLGKLFAQLEQAEAVSMLDYQIACIEPTQVIVPAFTRLAQAGKSDAITEVMNELPMDALDGSLLSKEDQATFPLGYWHEKARLLRLEEGTPDEEEERYTAQLLIRVEPSLKEKVMQRGGSKFVRSVLRANV